ncbi:hypothetical protein I302_101781 [Kwoniella bestiolae CBS 10118]|uniref:Uncharacterized protein n=1 Tax=Kwoniella bestiolae CBS 10118 TaxID=1296100 RepID=A0A1B9GD70_9TREE|nr:hypothetical protein I302_00461 [Kwoniella bestiolae CBS 10118]OCF28970.1 hypothetical protein I302_00461 [Kwoniella bestiolae CBS 10118]
MPLIPRWSWYLLLLTAAIWLVSRQTSPHPSVGSEILWPTQIDPLKYTYSYQGNELVNTTALFDQTPLDPIIKSLLKKAFAHNSYEAKVIPYYKKRKGAFASEDVTMITWLTSDRLGRLVRLAEKRRAPISVAYYIPPRHKLATRDLLLLDKLFDTHPSLSQNVDIHLVTSSELLQPNTWRTVAHTFAGTEWVLLWDADFEACTDPQKGLEEFRANVRDKKWLKNLDQGRAALVIPSYEWVDPAFARKRDLCPTSKKELSTLFHNLTLDAFETHNPVLSHATEYNRAVDAASTDYYEVTEFEFGYEVYAIFRRDADVWYDQRLVGYGYDRGAFTAQLYLSGIDLYVLPGQYAVHEEHPSYTERRRDSSGMTISWLTFQLDMCHHIFQRLAAKGELHGPTGERAIQHCSELGIPELQSDLDRCLMDSRNAGARRQ